MKVLLLGYSSIARRRVLPALQTAGIERIDIASASASKVEWGGALSSRFFRSYDVALAETDADVVYISTVNSLHAGLARKALDRGLHVAIDKPAFLGPEETRRTLEIASHNNCCIAEATVYAYHPRILMARRLFEEAKARPTHIVSVFSFPPHPPENFRYKAALGGGAMWDLGPYAITPGRIFFGEPPLELVGRILSTGSEVDTAFSLLATYPAGCSAVGSFGYTTGYMNRLDIMGSGITVTMERAFSPLTNTTTELRVHRGLQSDTITVPPADTFALFFGDFFQAIAQGDHFRFTAGMLADADAMGRLRNSALAAQR